MKEISCKVIAAAVAQAVIKANIELPAEVCHLLEQASGQENRPAAAEVYRLIEQNIAAAKEHSLPLCQDTGSLVCLAELGQELHITDGLLTDAINEGVREGYLRGCLRKSIVAHPLLRENTGDNTPAIVHIKLAEGEALHLKLLPKGGGAENMSALCMLPPAAGRQGVLDFVVQTVKKAGANACPPLIIGVGLGGNFEQCALLAKEALTREGEAAKAYDIGLEQELLGKINALGIGAQGFGGDITALQVRVESRPCHIASLPVAVNINCHVARHIELNF